jgi:dihydrofolate reductase
MHIFLIAAVSKDGFIARSTDQTPLDWTSSEDKKYFRDRTIQAGVIVMGDTTFQTIGHPLPQRLNIVYSKTVKTSTDPNLRYTNLTPKDLIKSLEQEGFKEVAICGGSSIYTQFIEADLIDTLYLTEENVVLGSGIPLFRSPITLPTPSVIQSLSPKTILKTIVLHHH